MRCREDKLDGVLIVCAGGEITYIAGENLTGCVQLQLEYAEKFFGGSFSSAINRGRSVIPQNGLGDGEVDIFGFQTFGEAQIAVPIRTGKKAEIWFTKPCEFGIRIR